MSLRLEDEVRAALRAGAESITATADPYARVKQTVAVRRRRRQVLVVVTGVAALALAGMIGLGAGLGDQMVQPPTPATEELPSQIPTWDLPSGWMARGALGSDPDFVTEFNQRLGSNHHLIFAEDEDAGRVVVAISAAQETVVFHGPRGADLDALERVPGLHADTRDVVVAVPQDGGHLVLALMPDNLSDAQISAPTIAGDGSVGRIWRPIPVQKGVGRLVTSEPIGVVRVRTPAGDGPPHVVVGDAATPPGTLTCGRCDSAWLAGEGLDAFREEAAVTVGVAPKDVMARLVVDVELPSPEGAQGPADAAAARVVGYVVTLPSGALLRATYLATTGPGAPTLTMVEPLRPLPADDEARPALIPAGAGRTALIVAPGASRVVFTPRGDAVSLPDAILTDGVGAMAQLPRDPAAYRVTSYGPDGTVRRTWHGRVMETDDPLQIFNEYRNRSMT